MKFECRFLKRMVWCIIIPSRGKAHAFSIVRPAVCAGATLFPFAPLRRSLSARFKSSPGNDVTQRPYSYTVKMASRAGLCADFGEENGVGGYNKNRTLRLGVSPINDHSLLPGLPSCGLRLHSGRLGRGEWPLSIASGTPLPCGSII